MFVEEQGNDPAFELENRAGAEIVKTCTCCGRAHTAADWMRLPFGGVWDLVEKGGGLLVVRSCTCTGTMVLALIPPRKQ